jgi:hypothetical protein
VEPGQAGLNHPPLSIINDPRFRQNHLPRSSRSARIQLSNSDPPVPLDQISYARRAICSCESWLEEALLEKLCTDPLASLPAVVMRGMAVLRVSVRATTLGAGLFDPRLLDALAMLRLLSDNNLLPLTTRAQQRTLSAPPARID